MNELISIAEAAKILGVTIPTVSYYIRSRKWQVEHSAQRTSGRRQKRLVYKADVIALKESMKQPTDTPTP